MDDKDVIKKLYERRSRAITGEYNCFPIPFERFRNIFPGFEQGRYLLVTAKQKEGKTTLADFIFVYEAISMLVEDPSCTLDLEVLYFTLEEDKYAKYVEFFSYLLFRLDKIRVPKKILESTNKDFPCPEEYIHLIESEKYQRYIRKYNEVVTFYDDISNPTGVFTTCKEHMEDNGSWTYKTAFRRNRETGETEKYQKKDIYINNNPSKFSVCIFDNAGLTSPESGLDLRRSIDKLSKYFIQLRNHYHMITVLIQHQNTEGDGNEAFKLGRMAPSIVNLGDAKTTARDVSSAIGLFSPFAAGLNEYMGYNIKQFGDHFRTMHIICDRDYGAGGKVAPLFFDGAARVFKELPQPDDTENLDKFIKYIQKINKQDNAGGIENKQKTTILFINSKHKKHDRTTNRKKKTTKLQSKTANYKWQTKVR